MNREIETFTNFLLNHNFSLDLLEKFRIYHSVLNEKSQKLNLISKNSLERIWTAHFLDSILICEKINFSNKTVLDFGSGGGFPGIPLKIFYPSMELYCVESIRKKVLFLRLIKQELKLQKMTIINSRFEELDNDLESSFDHIVVRAVKMNDEYFAKAFTLLKPSGKLILYKSTVNNDEVDKINRYNDCEATEIIRKEYSGLGKRALIIVKKHG